MLRLHEFQYHRPRGLEEALALAAREDTIPIAGGTDLVPNMKHRLFTPNHLVALKGVGELRGIALLSGDGEVVERAEEAAQLSIGAAETLAAVSRDVLVQRYFPSLSAAAGSVGGPQIRNQGTIGGNLCLDTRCTYYNQSEFWRSALGYCLKKDGEVCHVTKVGKRCVAANSADTPPVLMTLGGWVDLVSPAGERSLPVTDFFVADGVWNSVRRRDELVRRVRIPLPLDGTRAAYRKVRQRNSIDFPLLSIAVAARLAQDRTVDAISVVVSTLGARPKLVSGLDAVAAGRRLDAVADAVAQLAHRQCHPLENLIVDPEWRHAMIPVYVRRALEEL